MDRFSMEPTTRRGFSLALGGTLAALALNRAPAEAAPPPPAGSTSYDIGPKRPVLSVIFSSDTSPIRVDVHDPQDNVTHTFQASSGTYVFGVPLAAGSFRDPHNMRRPLVISAVDTSNPKTPISVVALSESSPFPLFGVNPQSGGATAVAPGAPASASGPPPYSALLVIAYGS